MRIARDLIDPDADKVVRRLARHGFQAYLVGGCVRDLLLSRTPKDFDVATSATPKEIRQLFRNCRIIGRRFRLAHIFFGSKIIETSTFRANPRDGEDASETDELLIRRDNVFGTDTEDARRRDFTINGLFYDVEAEQVIDHVGGLADLERRVVRTIGDPAIRFREDPVRMLRAVKFAARLELEIEPVTLAALVEHRSEIAKCAQPRVLEEIYRLLRGGAAKRSMELLIETGIATVLAPHFVTLFDLPSAAPAALPPARTDRISVRAAPPPGPGPAHHAGPDGVSPDGEEAGSTKAAHWGADETGGLPEGARSRPASASEESAWAAVWRLDDEQAAADIDDEQAGAELDDDVLQAGAELDDDVQAGAELDDDVQAGAELDDDVQAGEDDSIPDVFSGAAPVDATPMSPEHKAMGWSMLGQLDEQFRAGIELTNSLLLAALCAPYLADELLETGVPQVEAGDEVLQILLPLVQQLQVARRDAERSRQILLAQRRLAPSRRRRGKPMALVRREFFSDALLLYQMMATIGGHDLSDLVYWSRLHGQDGGGERGDERGGKRRRRRRGGRRRRRTQLGEEQGSERDPGPTRRSLDRKSSM
jgi:hypothetical protein